jgi:hypothetical protein
MFKKTIAVLLIFSIALSSCGKKDKDKSNDFMRTTHPTDRPSELRVVKSYDEALNDCIKVHLSCPVPSRDCHEAQVEDSAHTSYSWQDCLNSEICPEFKVDFHKTRLDCFDSEVDYLVAQHACFEARLACPNLSLFDNCPGSELVCDKFDLLRRKSLVFLDCPKYVPASSNPKYAEYSEARGKYSDASDKVFEECHEKGADQDPRFPMNCLKARVEKVALNIPYIKAQKACLESEPNDTNPS